MDGESNTNVVRIVDLRPHVDVVIHLKNPPGALTATLDAYGVQERDIHDIGFPCCDGDGRYTQCEGRLCLTSQSEIEAIWNIRSIQYRHYALVGCVISDERMRQLVATNLTLAWMLIDRWVEAEASAEELNRALGIRRAHLLQAMLETGSNKAVKFLGKIVPFAGSHAELRLAECCSQKEWMIDAFSHWREIPISVLYAISQYRDLAGAEFLFDHASKCVSHAGEAGIGLEKLFQLYSDTCASGRMLGIKRVEQVVKSLASIKELGERHDRWVRLLNRKLSSYDPDIEFPVDHFVGGDSIERIRSANALLREAKYMENCLATYVQRARVGGSLLFRVYSPERATMELTWDGGAGKWTINEIRGRGNGKVLRSTEKVLYEWLNAQQ